MAEKKEERKKTYLEILQDRREAGDSKAQLEINKYFMPKKKRADRKKKKTRGNWDD
jgi:hypothetical protein